MIGTSPSPSPPTCACLACRSPATRKSFSFPTPTRTTCLKSRPRRMHIWMSSSAMNPPNGADDQSTDLGVVNVLYDDNFDVTFHRKGISYEVHSQPDAKPWLLPILQSWDFTN